MTDLTILHQDDHLVAIDKPPGLLVHRSPLDRHETRFAVQLLRDKIGRHVYPVHRLDRPTSGVLLFAYSGATASHLGVQLMQKQVRKQYLAIVRGHLRGSGRVDYALRYRFDKIADKHRRQQLTAQSAQTEYTALAHYEVPLSSGRYASSRYSLVALSPLTGRKHQLRRHCAHLRHPIIGDTTHGDGKQNKFLRQAFTFENLALSCTQLGFSHPVTGQWTNIHAGVHPAMQSLLNDWQAYLTT
ncbi:pseudouridine synthase [Alteromonas sp. ASW11-19]|uniref:tRNA pseudouridine synthase C n=1 Tax=Alteromonas salexigens TaxID=2982530 RepID=A0ABT2VR84_9ALTE|nr:pseudouridine synthase [Alteromonas salexigens]MCU7554923.1 pseudouridine synthase [Alteromonas salexigens]